MFDVRKQINGILPSNFDNTDYCQENYSRWEDRASNWLVTNGFAVFKQNLSKWAKNGFYTIEKDSFGPLIRGVDVSAPTGEKQTLIYG